MNKNLYIEETNSNLFGYLKQRFNIIRINIPISKILKTGNLYSPPFTSIFFKYTLGCYIEALNQGANIIVENENKYNDEFIFEYQITILKSLGYKFKYIKIYKNNHISYFHIYNCLKQILTEVNLKYFFEIIKPNQIKKTKIDTSNILIVGFINKYIPKSTIKIENILKKYKIKTQEIPIKISFTKMLFIPYYQTKIKKYLCYTKNITLTNIIYEVLVYSMNSGRGIIYIQDELDAIETNIIPIIKRITAKYQIPFLIVNIEDLIQYNEDKFIAFSNQLI